MSDLISRQAAIDAAIKADMENNGGILSEKRARVFDAHISRVPPVQPDVPDTNVGDMISRQVAMEMLMAQNVIMDGSEYHNGFNAGVNRAQEVIRNLPPVQPKRGKWIINTDGYYPYCSKCKKEPKSGEMTDFCPNCGADMRCSENPNS